MDAAGVIGLIAGLTLALSPKGRAARWDPSLRRLGWVLAAVSVLLLLTDTVAPPATAEDQVPTAPNDPRATHYPVTPVVSTGS
jgi:hypothetical protein